MASTGKTYDMSQSHKLGREAEALASRHLVSRGYRLLEQNWYFGKREVDIICTDEIYLVIVEVKAFNERTFPFIDEVVTRRQQRFLVETAEAYLRFHPWMDLKIRFDVILVTFCQGKGRLEHFEDAFYPEAE